MAAQQALNLPAATVTTIPTVDLDALEAAVLRAVTRGMVGYHAFRWMQVPDVVRAILYRQNDLAEADIFAAAERLIDRGLMIATKHEPNWMIVIFGKQDHRYAWTCGPTIEGLRLASLSLR